MYLALEEDCENKRENNMTSIFPKEKDLIESLKGVRGNCYKPVCFSSIHVKHLPPNPCMFVVDSFQTC